MLYQTVYVYHGYIYMKTVKLHKNSCWNLWYNDTGSVQWTADFNNRTLVNDLLKIIVFGGQLTLPVSLYSD